MIFLLCLFAFAISNALNEFEILSSVIPSNVHRIHMMQDTLPKPVTWSLVGKNPKDEQLYEIGVEYEIVDSVKDVLYSSQQVISSHWKSGILSFNHSDISTLPVSIPLSFRIRVILSTTVINSNTSLSIPHLKTAWSVPVSWIIIPSSFMSSNSSSLWICTSPITSLDTRSSMLRTDFTLPPLGKAVTSAVLHITGLGQYRVYINGNDILGNIWNAPGQTDWRKRILVSSFPIDTSIFIPASENSIGVILGNGMYNVPSPPARYTKWTGSFGPRMLLLSLVIMFNDGSNMTINSTPSSSSSSSSWIATDGGPISFSHEYAGEDYNESLSVFGWNQPFFDITTNPLVNWTLAQDCTLSFAGGSLSPSLFNDVSIMDILPAISIIPSSPPGTMLVDVGRNFAGFASLTLLNVPSNYSIRVWPSETMENGIINQASGGTPMYWQYFPNASSNAPSFVNVTISPTFSIYGWRWLAVQLIETTSILESLNNTSTSLLTTTTHVVDNTVTVLQSSYGLNCNAGLIGDVTQAVSTFCNSQSSCLFTVCVCGDNTCVAGTPPCLPDPANNCAKDFTTTWFCTNDPVGFNRTRYIPAEANNQAMLIDCGIPPPPPPKPITPTIDSAKGLFVRSSVPIVGTWNSSNEWVNRIHNITLEAIASNLQSVLTDCPHRERLGWLEVSWLMFPSIAYNYDISRLWSKIALDTVDSQQSNGMVPDIAPEYTVFSGGFRDSPEWGSAAIQNPAFLLDWYDDLDIIQKTYNTSTAYVNYLLSQVNKATGLLEYGLGDWIPVISSPIGVTPTGTLIQDLQALTKAATILGYNNDATNFTALATLSAQAYERAYYSSSSINNTYPTQAAAGYALALNFSTNIEKAQEYIVNDVITRGNVTTAGEVGNRYAMIGLAKAIGGLDALWASLLRTDAPGYGVMLTLGETALAESWYDVSTSSHIHAMYGHIDEIFYSYYAGIQQELGSTGWRHVLYKPHPLFIDGIGSWINATFHSPRGILTSHSRVTSLGNKKKCILAFTCPIAVECNALLPLSKKRIHIPGSGEEIIFEDSE